MIWTGREKFLAHWGDSCKDGASEANYCVGATDMSPELVRYNCITIVQLF